MEEKLIKGQVIYIDNRKYTIINMIEFIEDTWVWQEYEIRDEINNQKWLSIEKNEYGEIEYCIYTTYYGEVDTNSESFIAGGKEYKVYEKGIASVRNYFGNADVDIYEKCEYIDYITKDENYIISVEIWGDEIEKTQGEYIEDSRIKIIKEESSPIKPNYKKREINENIIKTIIYAVIFVPMLFVVFIPMFSEIFENKTIQKYIEKQSKYTYVTSITNNMNNKKAKVYKSPYTTIDQTVKDIIDAVPEKITNTIDSDPSTEDDGIGLHTSKEFAYIYLEDEAVYVQISEKEYVNNTGGSTYHSRHHHYYYSTFNSMRKSTTYTNYSNSARQQSLNSRTTSGGGTSSGK